MSDELYTIAKQVCHEFGFDWYDPRTGKKYPAPKKKVATYDDLAHQNTLRDKK